MVGSGGSGSRSDRLGSGGNRADPKRIGRYVIKGLLGRGGQGSVYLAHDPNLSIDVALKVLHSESQSDELLERFKGDARSAVSLNHPNIVRIYNLNVDYPYIAMEYCDGGDLNWRIKSRRQVSLASVVSIIRSITGGLTAAHEAGKPILHRDMKPGNVLFQGDVPKVADFGLAKAQGSATGLTTTRGFMGTVRYSSPEQLRAPGSVDARSDLWSVGVMFYELLFWSRPFDKRGDDFVSTAIRVRTEPPLPPSWDVPAPILAVVNRLLEKEPGARFASARETIEALDTALRAVPGAESLLVPPDACVRDLDRMAAEASEHLDGGRSEAASTLIRSMCRLRPDDSLSRFWDAKLKETRNIDPAEAPEGALGDSTRAAAEWLAGRFSSIQSLIHERNYREARGFLGEILVKEPDNTIALRWLERISEEEAELRAVLDLAHLEADRTRAKGDFEGLVKVWQGVEERFPGLRDVKAELAVATKELELLNRKAARSEALNEEDIRRQSGDLGGAIETWRRFVDLFPEDAEAVQRIGELGRLLRSSDRDRERQECLDDARRLANQGLVEKALRRLETRLEVDGEAESIAREWHGLRIRVSEGRYAAALERTGAQAEAFRVQGRLDRIAPLWSKFLENYPHSVEALGAVERARTDHALSEADRLRRQVVDSVAELRQWSDAGHLASLPAVRTTVTEALRAASTSLETTSGDFSPILANLERVRQEAERALASRIHSVRERLWERTRSARADLVTSEGPARTPGAIEPLITAFTTGVSALCRLQAGNDPIATLEAAEKRLEQAERGDATSAAQSSSEDRLCAARAELERLSARAAAVSEAWKSGAALSETIGDSIPWLSDVRSRGLDDLPLRALRALESVRQPGGSSPDTLKVFRDELQKQFAKARETARADLDRAREAWAAAEAEWTAVGKSLPRLNAGPKVIQLEQQAKAAAESLNADELTNLAAMLTSIARCSVVTLAREECAGALADEEAFEGDRTTVGWQPGAKARAPFDAIRGALVSGQIGLLQVVAEGSPGGRRESRRGPANEASPGDGAKIRLSTRERRYANRYAPRQLERLLALEASPHGASARVQAERILRTLPHPPSRFRVAVPMLCAVAAIAISGAMLRAGDRETGTFQVSVISDSGKTSVQKVSCNGREISETDAPRNIPDNAGVLWKLPAGKCAVTVGSGNSLDILVPEQNLLVLAGKSADAAVLLAKELDLLTVFNDGE